MKKIKYCQQKISELNKKLVTVRLEKEKTIIRQKINCLNNLLKILLN